MKLNEFIKRSSIFINLEIDSKKILFKEISLLVEKKIKVQASLIVEKLNEREKLGSTGVGKGAAIPHSEIQGIDKTNVIFVKLKNPIDFSAPDKKDVDLVFVIIAPEDSPSEHLMILSSISGFLKRDKDVKKLRSLKSPEEVLSLFSKY